MKYTVAGKLARQPRNNGVGDRNRANLATKLLPGAFLSICHLGEYVKIPFLEKVFLSESLWQERGRVKSSF